MFAINAAKAGDLPPRGYDLIALATDGPQLPPAVPTIIQPAKR